MDNLLDGTNDPAAAAASAAAAAVVVAAEVDIPVEERCDADDADDAEDEEADRPVSVAAFLGVDPSKELK